jgi:hypothetical protein
MRLNKVILTSLIVVFLLSLYGCNLFENKSTSASKLLMGSITGNDLDGNSGSTVIFSDVFIAGGGSGSSEQDGTVVNDPASVELANVLLDPNSDQGISFYNTITVDQIKVEYSRSDGRNVEGVDVPISFTQQIKSVIFPSESSEGRVSLTYYPVVFTIIRHSAKLEPPLRDLKELGEEKVLKLDAKITVYGTDGSGRAVEPAVGHVSIWCSNFSDKK